MSLESRNVSQVPPIIPTSVSQIRPTSASQPADKCKPLHLAALSAADITRYTVLVPVEALWQIGRGQLVDQLTQLQHVIEPL